MNGQAEPERAAMYQPLGFLLLMLGFGLRLDTTWQGLAWLLLIAGALVAGRGLIPPAGDEFPSASVPPGEGE